MNSDVSGCEAWDTSSSEPREDTNDTGGFSEHELLDIMYNACNTSSSGQVLASTIIKYLQTMTTQSPEQERVAALRRLLDPDCHDPHVNREMFHSTMREWISQCSQGSNDVESSHESWPDSSKVHVNELDLTFPQSSAPSSEGHQCSCDGKDLSGTVVELKHAHRKLNEQNSSLLRTVAQCEDVNLQLTLEITELRAKLASAQRSAVRVRSLTEELEETRRAFKEAQDRASRTQSSCTKLSHEIECLKSHVRRLEDKNEKIAFEKTCSEDSLNKLRKVNAELRAELEETLVMLTLRDREITKKDVVMDKMKNSHAENHKMIESLQSELMRLQEHSHQVLQRYDRHSTSPQGLYSREAPNLRSLQSEMQDMQQQQHHRGLDDINLPSFNTHDDIQSIIHRVISAELVHLLHNKYPERDSAPVEIQERPFPHRHQQQASIKQQLVNVLQELELHKGVWEEKGEKVEERRRAWNKEQKHNSQTGSQTPIPDSKKVSVVNWWKALSSEGVKARTQETRTVQELSETQAKLQQAEQAVSDMREQVCNLQASLTSAQVCDTQKHISRALCFDKETNTEQHEEDRTVETLRRNQRDAAVATDPVEITGGAASRHKQAHIQVTADGLLATLRKMEAMVNGALETAEFVKESEQRVCRVRERMDSLTQRVEEAFGRAAATDEQLNALEAGITKAPAQSLGLSTPADPESDSSCFISKPNVEPEEETTPAVSEPRFPMNGGSTQDSCSTVSSSLLPKKEEKLRRQKPVFEQGQFICRDSQDTPQEPEGSFIFPHTRSRPQLAPSMPTLPEEEEDSPEELDSSSSSPSTSTLGETRAVVMTAPTIVYPQQAKFVDNDDEHTVEQARPHSPRGRLARNSSKGPITTVDPTGSVIDLVKDQLPELQLSEEDRQKNLELLEQAKKVSDRFLMRRGRRSTSSLADSPTGLSPTLTPSSSPGSSRSSSLTVAPQTATEVCHIGLQSIGQHLEVPLMRDQPDMTSQGQEGRLLVDWKPIEKRKVSSGTLTPRFALQKENCEPSLSKSSTAGNKSDQAPATGVAKPVPRPPTQQAPCTAEIKTIGAFPPLMRAVSWDTVGSHNSRNEADEMFSDKLKDNVFKSSGYKDFPTPPGGVQKLSKLREEHKLMRNQSIAGCKLPELCETAEQEKGTSPSSNSACSEDPKEKSDAMPNISDVMLRKLKLHRGLPGCAPPLTEKEVENAFIQLSLAFRNDNYTLELRLKQAERERNMTEEDTEKELEEFKGALKMTAPQWQNMEQREAYQRLIETVSVLHRLATRLSSRAELVGAVRQEKRMNKATEVMMQYVENLKRTYEKDHAELTEFKKLANQNSNRCYGGSMDTGDDGVPRPSRSMSLTLGKALPRRRVSVAVVPKFNLLNIPGQSPATAALGPNAVPTAGAALPVLGEANDVKANVPSEAAQPVQPVQPAGDTGKSASEQESEPAKSSVDLEGIRAEIRAELKAKIEEEAYNKGYQEGLKQSKAGQEERPDEEVTAEKILDLKNKDEESGKRIKSSRRMEEVLVLFRRYCPKISVSRRLLWISLVLFVTLCVVISILTFFRGYHSRREDT
ncbi:uncharacterized protein mrvi1 isoform X3 [Gouania willdenowi]|nr:protein MRVI1 isoform X3 [Gouania willdenowi]XP_028331561.1 protein MRVI1 isoform X3 [Gouania willdenowi]